MSGSERDKLRAEVRAFTRAGRVLTNPVANLLASLARAEELVDLAPPVPLVDVDPFRAVPEVPNGAAPGPVPAERWARRDAAAPPPPVSTPPRSTPRGSDPLPMVGAGSSDALVQAPVFSFRKRGGEPAHAAEPQATQPRGTGRPHLADAPGSFAGTSVAGDTPRQSVARAAGLRQALAQLEQSAGEVLRQISPANSAGAPATAQASDELNKPGPQSAAPRQSQLAQLVEEAQRLSSQGNTAPVARAAPSDDAQHGARVPRLAPPPAREVRGSPAPIAGSAVQMINAHAEHLLAAAAATAPDEPPLDAQTTPPSPAAGMPDPAGHTMAPRADEERAGPVPAPAALAQPDEPSLIERAFGRPLDAAGLAALVNEVLVEQARRHGVDLS